MGIAQAYAKLECPIKTPIEYAKSCIESFPVYNPWDYMACPLMSGTEARPCVYEGLREACF